ncbi:MAG: AmmeMemoRadiSam system protein B [Treponema sp.]|nr:AmmeMemoRadiSam system protein B [Treponema sp.]
MEHFLRGKAIPNGHRRRVPVFNGIFYSDNRETLAAQLASWGVTQGSSGPSRGGQVIIAPHGAWDVSGKIAAAAFAAAQTGEPDASQSLPGGIKRVILLGPCHGSGEQGIYLSESAFFQTPLGDLPVDREVNRKLESCSTMIRENDILHFSEHSLEILLPMIKYCFPGAKIVPIIAQGARPALISALARALRVILENYMEESLIVVSSNVSLSHIPAIAFSMADEFRSMLSGMDTGAFLARLSEGRVSACGGPIIAALLESGLLDGKRFSALTPLIHETEEDGKAVYYGAFATPPRRA